MYSKAKRLIKRVVGVLGRPIGPLPRTDLISAPVCDSAWLLYGLCRR